jgi:formylglycine-generating enzyme required for sulfatase activity
VGLTPPTGAKGYVARVRLFRGAFAELGEPRPDATIDTYVALPVTAAEGITNITVTLMTDEVATTSGTLDAPIAAHVGTPKGLAGTWKPALRVPCTGTPQPGEVCIPGGAYWMGNPLVPSGTHNDNDPTIVRIVALAPFFLDATEVTVAALRASGVTKVSKPELMSIVLGQVGPPLQCTWTPQKGNYDALPVTCIGWDLARAHCQALGKDLPSEAQLQYVASGLAGNPFVWGTDEPTCADAVYQRAIPIFTFDACPGRWVEPARSGAKDRLVLPDGGTVFDIAGNVAEHALDVWNLQSESCWGTGVFHDPVCNSPSADPHAAGQHTVVGGGWTFGASGLAAAFRRPSYSWAKVAGQTAGGSDDQRVTGIGFRCARGD